MVSLWRNNIIRLLAWLTLGFDALLFISTGSFVILAMALAIYGALVYTSEHGDH